MMVFGGSLNGKISGVASASSNLSPLAPPFTIDRTASRTALNINAEPYATAYNWGNSLDVDFGQHTHTPESDTSLLFPRSTVYSVSVAPPAEHRYDHAVYSSTSLTDSIPFSQVQTSSMANDFGVGNEIASSLHWSTFLVLANDGFGHKSSSTLGSVRNSQDNYTHSLSSLQYPSLQDPPRVGCLDIESSGKNSFLGGIAPEVPNYSGASTYWNYVMEGSELPKVLGESSGESWVPQINNAFDLQHNPVGSLGTDAMFDKSFPDFNAKATYASPLSAIPSRTSGISFTATPDILIMDSWGHLIESTATNVTAQKQHFSNKNSAPASLHERTIGYTPVVTSSTSNESLPHQTDVMHSGNDLSGNCYDIGYDRAYNVSDPWVCQRSKQEQAIKKYKDISTTSKDPQGYESSNMLLPTKFGEQSSSKNVTGAPLDIFNHEEADMHNLEGFSLLLDESDQDSPCWKGSSSYFSQFPGSEPILSQHHLKSKNSYDGLDLNEPQAFSLGCTVPQTVLSTDFHVKTTHSTTNVSLGEAETLLSSTERGYIGNHLYDESNSDVSRATDQLGTTERNYGNRLCFPSDNHRSVEAESVEMEPLRVKKPEQSNPIRLCLEKICFEDEKEKAAGMMNTDVNLSDAPEECHSYVPSNSAKQFLSSLSSDADISRRHNQENWDEYATDSKSMLLKTIVNLSDSLLFYYLNDENPVGNDDYKILELVLSKLTMCLKFAQENSSTKECLTRKEGPSNVTNEVQACHDEITNMCQVTKAKYQGDGVLMASNFERLRKPVRADGTVEAGSMAKAIKHILDANFHEDTESHPLATMYKNLWLEAEAVLCSTNYKARYHRMKNEMEKSRSHEEKEKSTECKASPAHVEVFEESASVAKPVHAADIMERYNILKCRAETSDKGMGGELDSSKISPDQRTVVNLSTHANDHTASETTTKDANTGCQSQQGLATNVAKNLSVTSLSSTYHTVMAEDHVMSKLQVLKSRGDYPKLTKYEQQPPESTMDSIGKKDGRYKTTETGTTKAPVVSSEDGFKGMNYAFESQPNCQNVEPGVQFSGGWYENTSFDWEHVLKDEVPGTGGAINP